MSKVHLCLAHCYCIMSAAISLPSYNQQYIPNILLNSHNLCSILNLFFPDKCDHILIFLWVESNSVISCTYLKIKRYLMLSSVLLIRMTILMFSNQYDFYNFSFKTMKNLRIGNPRIDHWAINCELLSFARRKERVFNP